MLKLNLKPKKADKLANQIYEEILGWIITGMLEDGDKLPSESEMCKSFQVSRPIVREAINKLQVDELVSTRKGSGTFVLHSPLKDLGRFASANDIAGILESHEVRMALEGEAAALAAVRRTKEHLDAIAEAQKRMEDDFDNRRLSIQPDFDFHVAIAEATGNEIFVQLLEDLHIGLKKTMAVAQNLSRESVAKNINPDRNNQVLDEHRRILDAIELQDQEAARLAMRNHIARIRQRLMNLGSR